MQDISAFGLRVQLVASSTFPAGITLSQFADDADPFDVPAVAIGDTAMGVNGDLITWSKANPYKATVNIIPGTEDDKNLSVLYEANRVGKGKFSARDEITLTGVYPDGSTVTLSAGRIVEGMPGASVASAGRLKTKAYQFHFESFDRS